MRAVYLCLTLLITPLLYSQTSISGTAPAPYRGQIAHLDILDDHLDVVTIADYQLLKQTAIDSGGRFDFGALTLPEGSGLYRLRYRMRKDPPVSMNFVKRRYLTVVASEGDRVRVNELSVVDPSSTNLALATAERSMDQYQSVGIAAGSDRQAAEAKKLRQGYLRGILHNDKADAYVRIYALGKLGMDEPTATDVLAGDEALRQTKLPASYRTTLDRELGAFAYHRLHQQNTWLKVALGISVVSCLLLGYLLLRQMQGAEPENRLELAPPAELTDKEREVFALAAKGQSNKEIAASLFVSVSTIKTHLNSIYRKLGIASRGELVALGGVEDSTPV